MGRLRNISASFKAAAFPTAATASSTNAYNREQPQTSGSESAKKELPAIVREASSNSVPERSSTQQSTSMIYTPPTIGSNDEIEELRPVFRYVVQIEEHGQALIRRSAICLVIRTNCTKRVCTGSFTRGTTTDIFRVFPQT